MLYIIVLGLFQSLISFALFRVGRQKRPADHLLGWLLLCIGAHMVIKLIIFTAHPLEDVRKALNTFIGLAYGPLIWMYARKVKDLHYHPRKHWYAFVPALLAGAGYFTAVSLLLLNSPHATPVINAYNTITLYLAWGWMLLFSIKALQVGRSLLPAQRAEQNLIKQVAGLFLILAMLTIMVHVVLVLNPLLEPAGNILARSIAYTILLLVSVIILKNRYLMALTVEKGVAENPEQTTVLLPGETMPLAVRKSVLDDGEQAGILEKLVACMEQKKLYQDADLNLDKLAAGTGIARHHISETLNQHGNQGFYQFVNEYRVREVIEQLQHFRKQNIHPNILGLAYDAGFKSKSSFNQYFKKITGITPSEYWKVLPSGIGRSDLSTAS